MAKDFSDAVYVLQMPSQRSIFVFHYVKFLRILFTVVKISFYILSAFNSLKVACRRNGILSASPKNYLAKKMNENKMKFCLTQIECC